MWFLIIWVATSLLTILITTTAAFACKNRLARKGYRIRKVDHTISEAIMLILKAFIPVYNVVIIIAAIFISEEKLDKQMLESLRKEGRIVEPEEWG